MLRKIAHHIQLKNFAIAVISMVILFSIATLATKQTSGSLAFNGASIKSGPAQQLDLTIDPFNAECPKGTHLECICVKDKIEPDFDNVPTPDETMTIDSPPMPDSPGLPYPGEGILPEEIPPWDDIPFPDVDDLDNLFDWVPLPVPGSGGVPTPDEIMVIDPPHMPDSPGLPCPGEEGISPWDETPLPDPDNPFVDSTPDVPGNVHEPDSFAWLNWLKKIFKINPQPTAPIVVDPSHDSFTWLEDVSKKMQERVNTGEFGRALGEAHRRYQEADLNWMRDPSEENKKKQDTTRKEFYDLMGLPDPDSLPIFSIPVPEPPVLPEPEPELESEPESQPELDPISQEDDGTFVVDDGKHWGCKLSISMQGPFTCVLLDGEKPDTCSDDSDCTFVLTFKSMFNRGIGSIRNYLVKWFSGSRFDNYSEPELESDPDPEV